MKTSISILILFLMLQKICFSQNSFELDDPWSVTTQSMDVDSLEILLNKTNNDTLKTIILNEISLRSAFNKPQKGLSYSEKSLELAERLEFKEGVAGANLSKVYCLWAMDNYSNSLQLALETLRQYENLENRERIAWTYLTIGNIYRDIGDFSNAHTNVYKGMRMYNSLGLSMRIPFAAIAAIYEKQGQLDSAVYYVQKALVLDSLETQGSWGWLLYLSGNIEAKNRNYKSALTKYREALALTIVDNNIKDYININNSMSKVFKETGSMDSCIFYAKEVFQRWNSTSYQKGVLEAVNNLADGYKFINQRDSQIRYLELSVELNNTLFNQEKDKEIQNLAFIEQRRKAEQSEQLRQFQNRIKVYVLISTLVVLLLIAFFLYRNTRHKQKAYIRLQSQKQETDIQKEKVEHALIELKSTQTQLIQAEKMASLGELTAGIAHEIQNPLNFVNNFSEISHELLDEMKEEFRKGDMDEGFAMADDIKQNLEKIYHHGKRADGIVKGMLQHSRSSSGIKEPTDINKLADEYLRLAYHGLRAKDKSFNAILRTDFDESLSPLNVVPQDIGRVVLNLINNAFYAVSEKKKQQSHGYEPTVSVSTKKVDDKVLISVKDNGNGIQKNILDKIFQPFFTTKPTGQGTGLGLSMSYDIVKAHGGALKVDTKEGDGSEFTIEFTSDKTNNTAS